MENVKAPLRGSYAPRGIRKVMQLSGQTQHGARRAPRYLECKGKGERLCIFSEMEPFVVDRFDDSRDGNLDFSGLRSEYHNWRLTCGIQHPDGYRPENLLCALVL